jgi:hypothetical protein
MAVKKDTKHVIPLLHSSVNSRLVFKHVTLFHFQQVWTALQFNKYKYGLLARLKSWLVLRLQRYSDSIVEGTDTAYSRETEPLPVFIWPPLSPDFIQQVAVRIQELVCIYTSSWTRQCRIQTVAGTGQTLAVTWYYGFMHYGQTLKNWWCRNSVVYCYKVVTRLIS